ncbi:type II toxin-antitoxin system Phd/YefM family antitoxin [Lacticaseibacillus chiayiensis]|uniref:Antitoxin n=1 Tax=Lacticaseibacillus chiayiensis TaxID=2100821 RepID=A0ABY6H8W6_9LACO|nr:type II toxin-antitoxin system Phd/YefM family antitoxin [Lacticaseibacillus chiayiensis]UYN57796.1 type II toxin-antitoxin system Phd/YefM family antitoxin [Lacticaseibacillus chiayiensis]
MINLDTISAKNFQQNFDVYMRQVAEKTKPLVVTAQNPDHSVVLMSKRDFDANEETMYLLSNSELMARIKHGDAQVAAGKTKRHQLRNLGIDADM